MMISKPQTDTLAALAVELRPDGAQPWDVAGVRAAIAAVKDTRSRDAIVAAVVALAVDPLVRTPGFLRFDGPHWRDRTAARASVTPTPPQVKPFAPRPADAAEVARRGAAACRAALEAAKGARA